MMLLKRDINYEKKIFFLTILVRLFTLILVAFFSIYMEKGFFASDSSVDDWRYEEGGYYYSQNATSLIDSDTFTEAYIRLDDNTGYNLKSPFSSTPLWYWIVCIVMYITKTHWTIRILNIIIAGFSSIVIYNFTRKSYGEKVARLTSKLFALLPYPIIFSNFSYKDHLVSLFTFYLLNISLIYRYTKKIKIRTLLSGLIIFLLMMMTRSGLSILLLIVCFIFAFIEDVSIKKFFNIKILLIIIVLLLLTICFSDILIFKFNAYLNANLNTKEAGNTISLVTITEVKDLYKLPLTYIFSIIMPISIGNFSNSWLSVVSNINFVMIPIAIGSLLYIFTKKKRDKIVFYSLLGYYLISIIMSTGIFRHYYSLLPITFISFSDYIYRTNEEEKLIWITLSILGIVLIFYYYFFISY